MAQIGTNEPSINDLISLFGNAGVPTLTALDRNKQSAISHDINQRQALQDMFQKEQNLPLDLESKRISNDTSLAQLPGITAQSEMLGRKNTVEDLVGAPMMSKGATADIQGKISKQHQQAIEDLAIEMAGSKDPAIAKQGKQLFMSLPDFIKEDIKSEANQKRDLAKIRAQGQETRLTNKELIEGGKFDRGGKSGGAKDPYTEMLSKGKLKEAYLYKAMMETDPSAKAEWKAAADAAGVQQQELEAFKAQAAAQGRGGLGMPEITGRPGPVVVPPVRQPLPTVGPGNSGPVDGPIAQPPAPMQPNTLPNGRVVVYKDGKAVGSIPKEQLQEALKQGYTLK